MAKIQKRAKAGKRLKQGKKLEATRPLTVKGGGSQTQTKTPPQPYLQVKLTDVIIS